LTESPEPVIYTSSVKIEQTAKGLAMVTVHVYASDDDEARKRAVALYVETLAELKAGNFAVASEIVPK